MVKDIIQSDIFIPARLGSKRLPSKPLKEINGQPVIKYLIDRLKLCKSIKNIVVCTTDLEEDDVFVKYLKNENVLTFRGSEFDILKRFLNAAKTFNTEIIIDVEADKIYTDPKYVDLIIDELQDPKIDFVTGNNSLDKFDPAFGFHGFVPAGFKISALEKICELKKTDNTETGYKEFFTSNKIIKTKFLLPEHDITIPNEYRFALDYPEDFKLAEIIISKLGNNFSMRDVLQFVEKNPSLGRIIEPVIKKWENDYKNEITDFTID